MDLRKKLAMAVFGFELIAQTIPIVPGREKLFKVYAFWDAPYSCLENYESFRMHCVRLSEGGGADKLILDDMGKWYYATNSNGSEKAPDGKQFYKMYNSAGQKQFLREPVARGETKKEYCAKQYAFCQNPPIKRLPPYKVIKQ
ncbi:MAG: hypothetical protein AABX93_00630 [Nanoarchaeota archaeon]|mgnify:CR=1 FL=1